VICLGIEGTAEKTGVGIVDSDGNILVSVGNQLFPKEGGIHPREAAEHHAKWIPKLIPEACEKANIDLKDIDLISFSKGPGLGPGLRITATAARTLALSINRPIIGVNHCIGHIEIGKLDTGAQDPVSLYVSGGNSQIIAYEYGRYRVFGETLDIAIGNALDHFGRETGLEHPGGPVVEKLAKKGSFIDLPYTVKGMDLSFSGLMSAAIRKFNEGVAIEDICYSFQETAFSMLVEVIERALSHTKKDEVLLCGGVAANKRLRKMLNEMTNDHFSKFYIPEMEYCGDNGAMIAWLGILTYNNYGSDKIKNTEVIQRFRTDEVDAPWVGKYKSEIALPKEIVAKGAEADIYTGNWINKEVIIKKRVPKTYRIKEIDDKIRKSRTKKEAKLLSDVKRAGVLSPILYDVDLNEKTITMEKIKGKLVKDVLGKIEGSYQKQLSLAIGFNIGLIHQKNIIHGDITSSNIMFDNGRIGFIDFGLGRYSNLIEDKCVDLLVFKKSLQSIDYRISKDIFDNVLDGYISSYNKDIKRNKIKAKIIKKIADIESRGRYSTH
jgi:bifunctional N6-L-threonylcarbamoyladenine synthase / protein kinase Bud32